MALTDAIQASVSPRVLIAHSESEDRHYLTIGWCGYVVERDITHFYLDAVHGRNGAPQALQDMARDLVVDLARVIARGEPVDEVLAAEIEAHEDEGELH